ncbi:hypothetical protein LP420_10540 [Massilia sp. B-10]|nr:hypothetical protein LP420_10540 [Massilia sp. B-10]
MDWNLSSGIYLPRWKSNLSLSLAKGAHAFNANFNFVGEVSLMRKYDKDETYATPFCHYGASTGPGQNRAAKQSELRAALPRMRDRQLGTHGCQVYLYRHQEPEPEHQHPKRARYLKRLYDPASGTSTTTGAPLIGYNSSLHNPYGRYFSLQAKYTF